MRRNHATSGLLVVGLLAISCTLRDGGIASSELAKIDCKLDGSCDSVCRLPTCSLDFECAYDTPICGDDGQCYACVSDDECAGGTCTDGACVVVLDPAPTGECTEDADCPTEGLPLCDGGRCVECVEDAQCATGTLCAQSECAEYGDGTPGVPVDDDWDDWEEEEEQQPDPEYGSAP